MASTSKKYEFAPLMGGDKTVIVGGSSPNIHSLPKDMLQKHTVIGINEFAKYYKTDYFIACDTFRLADPEWKEWLDKLNVPKFWRERNSEVPSEMAIPDSAADVWFKQSIIDTYSQEWDGSLLYTSTTGIPATDLAIKLGAEDVVLFGVDLIGDGRFNGTQYPSKDFWEVHVDGVNRCLEFLSQFARIWKTNPDSPLSVPLYPPIEKMLKGKKSDDGATEPGSDNTIGA